LAGPQAAPQTYTDLSLKIPPHWQLVDACSRNLQAALNTGGFFREPAEYAALKKIYEMLVRLVSNKVQSGEPDNDHETKSGPVSSDEDMPDSLPTRDYGSTSSGLDSDSDSSES
jgi:hypothetical protein